LAALGVSRFFLSISETYFAATLWGKLREFTVATDLARKRNVYNA